MLKKLVLAVALLLACIHNANADINTEKARIQSQIDSLQKQLYAIELAEAKQQYEDRKTELEGYLKVFGVDSLSLGKPVVRAKCSCEQYGVYRRSKHIRDIQSNGFRFSKAEFLDVVLVVLKKAGIVANDFMPKSDEVGLALTIHPAADSLLKAWGGGIKDNQIDYGDPNEVLEMDSNTKTAEISAVDSVVVVVIVNHDGTRVIAALKKGAIISMDEYH